MFEENVSVIQETLQLISAAKKSLTRKYFTGLNAKFIEDIRTLNFAYPKRIDGKPSSRLSSMSTVGSEDFGSQDQVKSKKDKFQFSATKVNQITEYLLQFEERCFVDKIIGETQLRSLRSLNRSFLGKVLENTKLFRHQETLLIAINILMFNSSKVKITKGTFRELIFELSPKTFDCNIESCIQTIKNSKTYESLKSIIKCQT